MSQITTVLGIGLFGALGALARFGVGQWLASAPPEESASLPLTALIPIATLAVNLIGCFLLGMIALSAAGNVVPDDVRRWLAVGFLGALTTYSTFGVETFALLERGFVWASVANVGLQLVGGLIAVWLGASCGRAVWGALP